MRKLLFICVALASTLLIACGGNSRESMPKSGSFGEAFTTGEATDVSALPADSLLTNVHEISGTVAKVCKGEGCWVSVKLTDSTNLRINTKDKAFVLPLGIEGKHLRAKGEFTGDEPKEFTASGIVLE